MNKFNKGFAFFVCFRVSLFAQDSLRILKYPSVKDIDIIVTLVVTPQSDKFRYEYSVTSLMTSKQNVWVFDVTCPTKIESLKSPNNWNGELGRGVQRISWAANDSMYFIRPGVALSGFSFISAGLPSRQKFYSEGWIQLPTLSFEPDSVVDGDILESAKQDNTIGPSSFPIQFDTLSFLDTLISYKHQALDLSWIKDKGIANSLDQKLENARAQLEKKNSKSARNILQAFINEVEAQKDKHLSSVMFHK